MRVIVVVSVVFLGACAVSSDKQDLIEDSKDLNEVSNSEAADYEPVDCFDFKDLRKKNIIGKLFKKFEAKSPGTPVEKCSQSAKEKNVQLFGIQNKKGKILCREGDEKIWEQDPNAKIGNKCKNGIGFKKSVFIYRKSRRAGINKQCIFEDKLYVEGDTANMYHPNDDMCKTCECYGGAWVEPCEPKMYCDTPLKQCEETYLPPGHCCPVCKTANKKTCASMGRKYGDSWFKKANENCFYCRCLSEDREASCEKVQAYCLPTNCENPVIPEGKCCPECENQGETTPQAFTINTTPTTDAGGAFRFPWER